jgi:hypothetical protein
MRESFRQSPFRRFELADPPRIDDEISENENVEIGLDGLARLVE